MDASDVSARTRGQVALLRAQLLQQRSRGTHRRSASATASSRSNSNSSDLMASSWDLSNPPTLVGEGFRDEEGPSVEVDVVGERDAQIGSLLAKMQAMQRAVKEERLINEGLDAEAELFRRRFEEGEAKNAELKNRLNLLDDQCVALQRQLQSMNDLYQRKVEELELTELRSRSLHEENRMMQAKVGDVENQLSASTIEVKRVPQLEVELTAIHKELETKHSELNAATTRIEALEEDLNRKSKAVEEAEEETKVAEEKVFAKICEVHTLQRDLAATQAALSDCQLEVQEGRERAAKAEKDAAELEAQQIAKTSQHHRDEERWTVCDDLEKESKSSTGTSTGTPTSTRQWWEGLSQNEWFCLASMESVTVLKPLQDAWEPYRKAVGQLEEHRRQLALALENSYQQKTSRRPSGPSTKQQHSAGSVRSNSAGTGACGNANAVGKHSLRPGGQQPRATGSFEESEPTVENALLLLESAPSLVSEDECCGQAMLMAIEHIQKSLVAKDYELRRCLVAKKKKSEELSHAERLIQQLNPPDTCTRSSSSTHAPQSTTVISSLPLPSEKAVALGPLALEESASPPAGSPSPDHVTADVSVMHQRSVSGTPLGLREVPNQNGNRVVVEAQPLAPAEQKQEASSSSCHEAAVEEVPGDVVNRKLVLPVDGETAHQEDLTQRLCQQRIQGRLKLVSPPPTVTPTLCGASAFVSGLSANTAQQQTQTHPPPNTKNLRQSIGGEHTDTGASADKCIDPSAVTAGKRTVSFAEPPAPLGGPVTLTPGSQPTQPPPSRCSSALRRTSANKALTPLKCTGTGATTGMSNPQGRKKSGGLTSSSSPGSSSCIAQETPKRCGAQERIGNIPTGLSPLASAKCSTTPVGSNATGKQRLGYLFKQ